MDNNSNNLPEKVQELKEQGNECVRNKKYEEAVLHYSHAINLDPKNYTLYSNRSFSFLKIQQYYLAMEDAKKTISLNPDWEKGYFRKAEIEHATFHFQEAMISYAMALTIQPNDVTLKNAFDTVREKRGQESRADKQIPWLGAGVGIILGVLLVIADQLLTAHPTVSHPILMAILTISIAMTGYGIARGFRYYIKCQRSGMLEPPVDLLPDENTTEEEEPANDKAGRSNTPKYTKAQARYRFRKGKMS
uniref:Uncharacterized protein n=1 Tax=Clastoptera arizonana TaxID=38151 RepID=A0A1B6CJA7_9HEMI